jgi:subtilase-type serine protease
MLPSTAQSNTSYSLSILSGNFIGNTYSLENTSIDVASGSTITLNQTGSGTFSGSISGAGTVSILGTGPLTFTPSSSSYSGNTLLDGNIIITHDVLGVSSSQILGNGGSIQSLSSFSMPHDITLSSSLTFSPSSGTILELDGVITGTGGLVKEGSGSLYLTNTSSYTGNTYVNQGALVVAGNIPSSAVTVAAGAILGGTGSVGDADIHGTLAAGSSQNLFGTLNVVGDLVLEENSNFGTVLSPGHSSLVSASGPVTIPASTTYLIAPTPGTYQAFSSVVLRGSSITGRFSHINIGAFHANFLSSSLIYTGTEVILDATSRSIATLASGQNAINVANALDEVIQYNRSLSYTIGPGTIIPSSPPELVPIMASLWPITTSDEMTYALNQLHPAQMKGMAIAQQNNVVMVREALSQRLRNELDSTNCFLSDNYDVQEKNCCEKNKKILTTWVRGNGESLFQNNKDNSWGPLAGYRVNTGVLAAGIDGMFSKYFYAGALAGYTHSHLHWRSGKGTGDISSGYAGLYFSALSEIFYGNLSVIGSWNHYSASRHIKYGQVNLFAKNGHGGKQMLSHLDTGLNLHCYGLTLRPFDSFDYITQTENGYQEYNAGAWDLAIKKNNAVMMRNELGLQFAKCYCYLKAKWTLSPKFSWVREVRLNDSGFTVNFAEAGPSFFINGYFPKRSLFASGMTITALMLQDTLKFDLSYNGEFKGKYASSNYGGAVRYSF